jgi:hypothetical protein
MGLFRVGEMVATEMFLLPGDLLLVTLRQDPNLCSSRCYSRESNGAERNHGEAKQMFSPK